MDCRFLYEGPPQPKREVACFGLITVAGFARKLDLCDASSAAGFISKSLAALVNIATLPQTGLFNFWTDRFSFPSFRTVQGSPRAVFCV